MLLRTLMTPKFAPPSDGGTSPALPDTGASPTTPPPGTPEASASTKPEPSPSPEGDTKPEGDPKPEPTAEEKAAAEAETARAAVHTEASAYAVNLPDEAKTALGLGDGEDPIVKGITEHWAKSGKSQGALDDFLAQAGELAKAGLFGSGFDPAAEAAKLGETAPARRREVEVFAEALKSRGDITDEEHGELMSLSPTAAGITLLEKLRGMMGDAGRIEPPTEPAATGKEASMAKYREMRADPKYETDRKFRAEADGHFQAAHRKA